MSRVAHFEIHCGDVDRAMDFYANVLGWSFNKWGERDYYLVDGDGIGAGQPTGALRPRDAGTDPAGSDRAPNSGVVTFAVDDVSSAHRTALEKGGSEQMPVTEIADLGHVSYCYDTEGNVFGMITYF